MAEIYRSDIVRVDLDHAMLRKYVGAILATGDKLGNRFGAEVYRDGKPVDVTGCGVTAYFMRPGEDAIVLSGTASGSVVYVDLEQACYSKASNFTLTIKISYGGATTALRVIDGYILLTQTDELVAPGEVIPTLDDIFAQIAAMEAATERAQAATADAIKAKDNANGAAVYAVNIATEKGDQAIQLVQAEADKQNEKIDALIPPDHISNCWSIHAHQEDFMVLENGSTTPVHAYLDYSTYHFGVMNVHPGRMVYRDNVTDALFQKCSYMFRVVSVGKFEFGTKDGNGENQGILCWVSPKERLFKIFTSAWDGNNEIKRNLTLDFDILPGEIYVAEIVKQGLQQTTIRLSCTTDTNKRFEYTHTATGNQLNNKLRVCGGVAFHAIESTAEFKLYEMAQKVYVDEKYDLLIIGDSFVECGNTEVEASKSFAYMVHEMIGDKCNASGHGGATTAKVITRLKTDADIGLYKYAFVQVGSNDSAQGVTLEKFTDNMDTIIAFVESKGAIPILTTIPVRADVGNTAFINEANEWIKETGYKYVDEYTMLTSDKLVSDGIHPNEEGNQLILLSLMGLIPECF